MKCMYNRSLRDPKMIAKSLNIQNPNMLINACDDDAVTIIDGYALCKRHFNEHICRGMKGKKVK